MTTFTFRIRFHLVGDSYINAESDELTIMEAENGFRLRLKSGEIGQPIKSRSRAALIGGPYSTEEEARCAAKSAKHALLLWAVNQRMGIDLGDGVPRSVVTDYGRQVLEDQIGAPVRNDIHGVDIYPSQESLKFVSVNLQASFGTGSGNLVQEVSTHFLKKLLLTEKQVVAAELYCSSFFDVSLRSRLVTLMSAVEAILDPDERSQDAIDLVGRLDKTVAEANIDVETKNAMRGSLQGLRRESIGQAGRILSGCLLSEQTYLGRSASGFFGYCYGIRSQIVHDGHVKEKAVELVDVVNACQRYVAELLLKSFASTSVRRS